MTKPTMAAAIILGLCGAASDLAGQDISLPLGTPAPAASLEDLEGNPVQLLDFIEEGKPTLIEFWASWCENCEALQPQLDQIHQRWGSQVNVVAVAVAVSQSQRRVKRHVEEHGIGYPYLWDGDGAAVKAYEIPGTSIVVILDGSGSVVYTGSGRDQDLIGEIQKLVENWLPKEGVPDGQVHRAPVVADPEMPSSPEAPASYPLSTSGVTRFTASRS